MNAAAPATGSPRRALRIAATVLAERIEADGLRVAREDFRSGLQRFYPGLANSPRPAGPSRSSRRRCGSVGTRVGRLARATLRDLEKLGAVRRTDREYVEIVSVDSLHEVRGEPMTPPTAG